MTREELPELINKARVDETLKQAIGPISEFLDALLGPVQLGAELAVSTNDTGERTFSKNFRGYPIAFVSVGAIPGLPIGIGVKIFIADVRVDHLVEARFSRRLHEYLCDKYSDVTVLHAASEVLALSQRL